MFLTTLLKRVKNNFFLLKITRSSFFLFIGLYLSLFLNSCILNYSNSSNSNNKITKIVTIGYQPLGSPILLKNLGNLEKRLTEIGIDVRWIKYNSGPPIIEAMAKNQVDLGYVGDVPALLAQIKDLPIVYLANELPEPQTLGILVHKNSSIKTLTDLKNKKITVVKGSSAHYMLIRALMSVRLTLENIELVYLSAEKGQKAFLKKEVNAWAGWDPFLAELEEKIPVRIITNAEGFAENTSFYLANYNLINNYHEAIKPIIEELQKVGKWSKNNPESVAKILSLETGIKLATAKKIVERSNYEILPIQDRAIEEQQRIADIFYRLGIFSKQIKVENIVWKGKINN